MKLRQYNLACPILLYLIAFFNVAYFCSDNKIIVGCYALIIRLCGGYFWRPKALSESRYFFAQEFAQSLLPFCRLSPPLI